MRDAHQDIFQARSSMVLKMISSLVQVTKMITRQTVLLSVILFSFFISVSSSLEGQDVPRPLSSQERRGARALVEGLDERSDEKILFQKADTDGDGKQEIWDVINSTYSDPHKPLSSSNQLTRTLTIGTTLVLLIDICQRSAVPISQDFDGFPDVVWQPFTGIVNSPIAKDFDGDGLTDLGIDMDNDGQIDGALSLGTFHHFGSLSVSVKESENVPIQNAKVFIESNHFTELKKTDDQGLAQFMLVNGIGSTVNLKVESNGFALVTKTVVLDPWNLNSVTVPLARLSLNSGFDARNYPNPVFSGETIHMIYSISSESLVKFDLYDINFRFIKRIFEENKPADQYLVSFESKDSDGNPLEKGLYYGILRSGKEKKVINIVVK